HRDGDLRNDRPGVHFGGDEVDRRTVNFRPRRECARVRVESLEGRQQGRMSVEYAAVPLLDECRRKEAHEPGKADDLDAMALELVLDRALEGVAVLRVERLVDDFGRNSG